MYSLPTQIHIYILYITNFSDISIELSTLPETKSCSGHQEYNQEELGQISKSTEQRDQDSKGKYTGYTCVNMY